MTEEELYNMSDEELEQAMRQARSSETQEVSDQSEEATDEPEMESEEFEETEVDDDDNDDVEEYLEQPDNDEDSDDDTSSVDDDEEESEEDSETEEDAADEGDSDEEEQTDEDDDKSDAKEQPAQSYKFKANGKEFEFTEEEIRAQFPKVFGQAMDYTRKMQAIKPWRKTIDAIESAKLSHDDVNLMIDVLKGDKDAVAEVLKRTGVDVLDINTDESKYVAKDYGRDETTLEIRDVVDRISADPEFSKTETILSKEWDDRSWQKVTSDPELIELLHVDVRTGVYDQVQPMAEKLKVYDRGRKSDLEYYIEAGDLYYAQLNAAKQQESRNAQLEAEQQAKAAEQAKVREVKAKQMTRDKTKVESAKRKSAAPSKKAVKTKPNIDYLYDSDEAFEKWYAQLQAKM